MKFFRSIAFKLSALTCLCVLGVIALMARQILSGIEQNFIGDMQIRAEFFAVQSREAMTPKLDPFSLHFHVREMSQVHAVTRALVLDTDGKIIDHSDVGLIGGSPRDPATVKALHSDREELQRYDGKDGKISYDLSVPVMVGAQRAGTVVIGFDESSVDEALRRPRNQILVTAAVATGLALLGTILIVGWITGPLPDLAEAARKVAGGDFSVQVEWKSSDEVGTFARAFNEMVSSNSNLFHKLQSEREKLSNIFHDTKEGMIMTDAKGGIQLINPSARALLGCQMRAVTALRGVLEPEFAASPTTAEMLAGKSRITPFQWERREPKLLILSGVADRLGDETAPAGFLFIFHDGTLEKRGETMSRNFLSLVSHKLRTPLAVALGYAELIQRDTGNLTPMQKTAIAKIQSEDEKLRRLVEKLIAYSTVQSPESIVLDRVEVGLADLVALALKSAGLPEDGSIDLRWDPQSAAGFPTLTVDQALAKEVLAGFIDNAAKFNRAPKKLVAITAAWDGAKLKVTVKDDGPGIPGEEWPKLFRKFYQIDEHFTGQIPGFGLGLAFAKNVVEAHGGSVGLNSTPGRGSEFYFILPAPAKPPAAAA